MCASIASYSAILSAFAVLISFSVHADVQGAAEFEVERPQDGEILRASDYGVVPGREDCTDALNVLLDICRTNGAGGVVFSPGKYNFTADRAIRLANLKDFVFDGAGAEFVFFRENDVDFNVSGCMRLEMRDFSVDWDWSKSPLASLVEIAEASSDHVDFRFVHYGLFPRRDIRVAYTSPWDATTRR